MLERRIGSWVAAWVDLGSWSLNAQADACPALLLAVRRFVKKHCWASQQWHPGAVERQFPNMTNRLSNKLSPVCFLAVLACAGQQGFDARPAVAAGERPIPLVFDTDVGNDVDDVLALGVIHALVSRGECELAAVTVTKDHPLSASFVDAVNTFYGRGDIPIGVIRDGPTPEPSKFTGLANVRDGEELRFPHDLVSGADRAGCGRTTETYALGRGGRHRRDRSSRFFDEFGATAGVGAGRDLPPLGQRPGAEKGPPAVGHGGIVCGNGRSPASRIQRENGRCIGTGARLGLADADRI